MAYIYESQNLNGFKTLVLPLTIRRGEESSIVIRKVFVRNFSTTGTLSLERNFNFKLKRNETLLFPDPTIQVGENDNVMGTLIENDFNFAESTQSIITTFLPESNFNIPYDSSVTFIPPAKDYFYGVRGTLSSDSDSFTFRLSYEPIKESPQVGNHEAEVVVVFGDSNGFNRSFKFKVRGSCTNTNNLSIYGFDIDSKVESVYGFQTNNIIIH